MHHAWAYHSKMSSESHLFNLKINRSFSKSKESIINLMQKVYGVLCGDGDVERFDPFVDCWARARLAVTPSNVQLPLSYSLSPLFEG